MGTEFDFVDLLMDKAFAMPAPAMPVFTEASNDKSAEILEFFPRKKSNIKECSFEDLELLNAAGKQIDIDDIDKE